MNRRAVWSFVLAVSLSVASAAASIVGCGSDTTADDGSDGGDDGSSGSSGASGFNPPPPPGDGSSGSSGSTGGPNPCTPPTSIALAPADKVVSVTPGVAFTQAYTATATYGAGGGATTKDVTADSFFSVGDPGAGSFTGSTFTWSGTQGGKLTISAKTCGVVGTTTLTLKASVTFGAGGGVDAGADGSAGADGGLTGTFNGAPPTATTACNPTLVYPPDGVLVPPNTNVIEVHFTDGTPANSLFEISFENAVTDVKVYTTCTGATPAVGTQIGGGCVFELDQAEWDYIAKTNRDGDPVTVTVKGLGCDGSGAEGVSNTRTMSFARDDMRGTLYYWASAGATLNSGGIYRYDFGVRGQTATPVLTPTSSVNPDGECIGCHDVSRDGRKMIFDHDDPNSDDEYSDVTTNIFDIASGMPNGPIVKNQLTSAFPAGFHTWNRTTSYFLLSDGFDKYPNGNPGPNGAMRLVSAAAATIGSVTTGTMRGTTPDWAPDDSRVVFAVAPNTFVNTATAGYWMNMCPQLNPGGYSSCINDLVFAGASLYVSSWNATTKTLSAPTALLASSGTDNFYYPSFSPDGSLIVYNHADSGSNFHNPKAKIELVSASAATPARNAVPKLNDTGDITNSWARWAPFVQTYKGKQLLWVTTSSTRNYGLRIDNTGKSNCYPQESPKLLTPTISNNNAACTSTRLWMAAIVLDPAAVQAGADVSFPAFYLPFQDITTNNHLAQWAQKTYQGVCATNADCSTQPGKCCDNGGCTSCPTPPTSDCTTTSNCATGSCCNSGICGACAAGDGGSSDGGSSGPAGGGCSTCLDCNNQACVNGACGACTSSSQCCAPLVCQGGTCVNAVN